MSAIAMRYFVTSFACYYDEGATGLQAEPETVSVVLHYRPTLPDEDDEDGLAALDLSGKRQHTTQHSGAAFQCNTRDRFCVFRPQRGGKTTINEQRCGEQSSGDRASGTALLVAIMSCPAPYVCSFA